MKIYTVIILLLFLISCKMSQVPTKRTVSEATLRLKGRVDKIDKKISELDSKIVLLEDNDKKMNDSIKSIENNFLEYISNNTNTYHIEKNDMTHLFAIFFDFNRVVIKKLYHERISIIAKILKTNPDINIEIVGHTDKVGSEKTNIDISKKRAESVLKELIEGYDINPDRLSITIKGETDPLSKIYDDVNRRVDLIFSR